MFLLLRPDSDLPPFIINKLKLIKQLKHKTDTCFMNQNQGYFHDRVALSFADCFISFASKAGASHFLCALHSCTSV